MELLFRSGDNTSVTLSKKSCREVLNYIQIFNTPKFVTLYTIGLKENQYVTVHHDSRKADCGIKVMGLMILESFPCNLQAGIAFISGVYKIREKS